MSPLDRSEGIDLNGRMLVTSLALIIVTTACTSGSESTVTTASGFPTGSVGSTVTSAAPAGTGIEDGMIGVGVMVPRTGPVAAFGEAALDGQNAYWAYVNDVLGGVGGQFPVVVRVFDTAYDPDTAEDGFRELSGSVVGISGSLGTLIDERLGPLALNEGMLTMAGSLSSEWLGHGAVVPNLLLPTDRDQVAAGLVWATESEITGQTAILYQEGSYGEDCVGGYDGAVSDLGLSNVGRVAHALTATDFGEVVGQLSSSGAAIVVACTTPDALVRILATAGSLDFQPTWLVSPQSFDSSVPSALGGDAGLDAGLAALERTWVLGARPPADSPAGQLLDDVFGDTAAASWYTLLGYSQAATFHLILEEALEASDLTRPGLRAATGRLDGIDLGLDGPLSSLVGPVPVSAAAVGAITADSYGLPFGVPASEEYVASPFLDP
ncbi:MAG: ABC transporter substrate-binding protein [Acidimicrobiia bacterium]|nr:ABC transporter substrate-binding protein [Acidimicrobiia bacterium]